MPAKRKIDIKTFKAVKTMLSGGATIEETSDFLGVSSATISRIRQSETYEEYRQIIAAMWVKQKAQEQQESKPTAEPAPVPAPVPTPTSLNQGYLNNRIYELLKEQNEMLKLISNKMAFIVEQLV